MQDPERCGIRLSINMLLFVKVYFSVECKQHGACMKSALSFYFEGGN